MRDGEFGVRFWTRYKGHDPVRLVLLVDRCFIFHGGDVTGFLVVPNDLCHLILNPLPFVVPKLR